MAGLRTRTAAATVLAALLVLAACGAEDDARGAAGLDVTAAFYPLAEAVRQVGGPLADVLDLTPAGVEPHDLELKPSDVARIRTADLILYLGGGFQPALEDAIEALPDPSRAVDLLEGLPLRKPDAGDEPSDPHVWLDPLLFARIVERIAAVMSERLPAERTIFETRAFTYKHSLEELDLTFQDTLRSCARREIVTSHAAFGYLADRYGLEQISISGVSPEAEPSPRRLEEVTDIARTRGVTTIFFETLVSPRVAETIARTVGARTAVLNPIEGLTEEERLAGEDYRSLMRTNLEALARGLGCKQS
jgi:zinc transport system substrate-binding protein